jgi:hypothetical protein
MTRELYRSKAQECLVAAENIRSAAERLGMLKVARAYMALADAASRSQDHGTAPPLQSEPKCAEK